ncbi:MAG TPA: hypothetical protein ENI23_10930 [bacterium]|nr:hypothetical protein [bacterium]
MNQDIINKILESDVQRSVKEKILLYWLLPQSANEASPIESTVSKGRSGSVKRPNKEELDLRANPKKRETEEAMTETLDKDVKI